MKETIIKQKRTASELYRDWKDRKMAAGWKRYSIIAPVALLTEIKAVVRKYKTEHFDDYPVI